MPHLTLQHQWKGSSSISRLQGYIWEKNTNMLSKHQPYDCTIELQERVQLLSGSNL